MNKVESIARFLITWIVTILVPLALFLSSGRILFTPLYIRYQYSRPTFPADPYGFTTADRLKWGQISLDYLFNDAGIDFLGGQRLADGSPLYTERELSHMDDVKQVIQAALRIWEASLGILIGLGLAAWGAKWQNSYLRGLGRGGWLTLGLIVFILINVFISFDTLFTVFHQIFFASNSWIFLYSDTLIRLFPIPLWQNGFIMVGLITFLGGALLAWAFGWRNRLVEEN
jgi:integral membrane protein (TIGR01906 family)